MAGLTTVNVYRTPAHNASGTADTLVFSGVLVDIQAADDNPHQRDAMPGVQNMTLKTWWNVYAQFPPLPAIVPNDKLVDPNELDPLMNNQPAQYRVRRIYPAEGVMHCERQATAPTGSMSGG